MHSSPMKLGRLLAFLLWLGPLGFVSLVFMSPLGVPDDTIELIGMVVILLLLGLSVLLMVLVLNISRNLTWEDKRSWRLWLFFGGPITACYFLTCRNRNIGDSGVEFFLGGRK